MTVHDVFAEVVGFVPWGSAESLEPVWLTPTSSEIWPVAEKHVETRLRVLPDGSTQLTLRNSAGARVVRLGAEQVAIQSAADIVRDAVITRENVVILEQVDYRTFDVRCVAADGTTLWQHRYPAEPGDHRRVAYDSRLLTDSHGRVFVSTHGSLIHVDDSASTVVAQWEGRAAVMSSDGRIGYIRTEQQRLWVTREIETATETTTELDPEKRDILHDVVGVDAAGRSYWRGYGTIARMTPDGDVDWLVRSNGISVSEEHGATILTHDMFGGSKGRLAGRGDDGGYVLYQAKEGSYGLLSYLDRDGRPLRVESAPDDIWLTMDIDRWPDFSSVTPDGAVLVTVQSKHGVHVVRLTPDNA